MFYRLSFFADWQPKAISAGFSNERFLQLFVWESVTRVSGVFERRGTFVHSNQCLVLCSRFSAYAAVMGCVERPVIGVLSAGH